MKITHGRRSRTDGCHSTSCFGRSQDIGIDDSASESRHGRYDRYRECHYPAADRMDGRGACRAALNWLMPLPFVPAVVPAGWLGAIVFVIALSLVAWAIATITCAGSNVPTNRPTTTVVDHFTRNPIYLGMVLGLISLAIAFNSPWLLLTLAPFALVIRYGIVAREEAYLERKFGDVYRRYCARVRLWL